MGFYRKKPVVIEAFLLGVHDTPEWYHEQLAKNKLKLHEPLYENLLIKTLEGDYIAKPEQDYIIKGVRGELYPCKKDIFEETYEKVEQRSISRTR